MSATTNPERTLEERLRWLSSAKTDETRLVPDDRFMLRAAAAELDRLRAEVERKDAALRLVLVSRSKDYDDPEVLDFIERIQTDETPGARSSIADAYVEGAVRAALSPKEQT